jgi:thiamine-phosphate pyrophosphorylase
MRTANRIIDVNLNRLTEALKTVEDLCRFELEDAELLRMVRAVRSELNPAVIPLRRQVIPYRGSERDLGRRGRFDRSTRYCVTDVLEANLKRAEEACRTLEELTRLYHPEYFPSFKSARFQCYDLAKRIAVRSRRQLDLRLYVVMDTATIGRRNLARIARQLARAGVGVVQLREPEDLPTREFLRDAREIRAALQGTATRLIVNDRVDIALAIDADGVHLGQSDLPAQVARRMLPADKIIGVSVSTAQEARRAELDGADYLGASAVFATPSKTDVNVIGLSGLRAIRRATSRPIVAIGGMNALNARKALRAGADGIAVISAAFASGRIEENLRRLRRLRGLRRV